MRVVIVGANMIESQANRQVRDGIKAGWITICGDENVFSAPLASSPMIIRRLQPDIVICCGSYLPETAYYGELSSACLSVGAKSLFWATEDPYEIDASYRVAGHFEWIFTCDKNAVAYFAADRAVYHLPLAASPQVHYRPLRPYSERKIDIFFCGVAFQNRRLLIESILPVLRRHATLVIGPGWGDFRSGNTLCEFNENRIETDTLMDYYSNSKIVINMGRDLHFENKRHRVAPSTPGPRTFEAALAGTFQLFQENSWEIHGMFAADEIKVFTATYDLKNLLESCLSHPASCEMAASKSQTRALADHTYEARAREVLEVIGMESPL